MRLLLICQASSADAAVQTVRALGLDAAQASATGGRAAEIDVLCYGAAGRDRPAPSGTRLVGPSVQETTSAGQALRRLAELRRRQYDTVALAQPALGYSRARGILLAFAYFVGGRRAVIVDSTHARVVKSVTGRLALVDVVRWLVLNAVAQLAASMLVGPIDRAAARSGGAGSPGSPGSVVYLRTDIDLHVAPLQAGGSVAHTEGVLEALVHRGHRVAYWGTGEVDGIPADVRRRRLPAVLTGNLPIEIAELASGLLQGLALRRGEPQSDISFVYQRYSLNNLAGAVLAQRWRVPLVLEANGSEAKWRQDFSTLKYPRLAFACERLLLRRSAVIAAVSANAAEDLVAAGAPTGRVRVVPNGVSVDRFIRASPMPLPGNLQDGFVICFVGLFYPWHGVPFLAEAFAELHRDVPESRLLLVGDGEEAPTVRAVLERSGAAAATHMTGLVPRSDAPRYMAAADVLVSPHADVHRFIGSPIKLFEYMAAGKPIVATRVGQISEILEDEATALLVAPNDPQALAAALRRLRTDQQLGARLGVAARQAAVDRHSWSARLEQALADGPA